jgi:hypothetical protein
VFLEKHSQGTLRDLNSSLQHLFSTSTLNYSSTLHFIMNSYKSSNTGAILVSYPDYTQAGIAQTSQDRHTPSPPTLFVSAEQ